MVTSQDAAVAAALSQLGIPIHPAIEIVEVTDGMPADGKLEVRDVLRRVGDTASRRRPTSPPLIAAVPEGESVPITVERDGKPVTVELTPVTQDGHQLVGIKLQTSATRSRSTSRSTSTRTSADRAPG